ncbi:hypothetical protein KAT80_01360 [Candidatus Pacearchaeota archaeon]|nr:hypothetical protein [Candidatus Pacearchaeota archaeon]
MKFFKKPKTIDDQMKEQGFYEGNKGVLFFAEPLSERATQEEWEKYNNERIQRHQENPSKLFKSLLFDHLSGVKEIYIIIDPAKRQPYYIGSREAFCSKYKIFIREE